MEARLVREVRHANGNEERWTPQVVRHVVDSTVTRAVGAVLVEAVDDGTGTRAQMETFRVAGKSGTARLYSATGGYEAGEYFSSFAGFFPADRPQLVVFVKLERPQGAYYGGAVAAPVTRAAMEAALAARGTPLDRQGLLGVMRPVRREPPTETREPEIPVAQFAVRAADRGEGERTGGDATSVAPASGSGATNPGDAAEGAPSSEVAAGGRLHSPSGAAWRVVPDVSGLPLRVAVRQLHRAGFRVSVEQAGVVTGMRPTAGERIPVGDTIHLSAAPPGGMRLGGGLPER